MDSAWRVVVIVITAAAIVGLILFARGPVDHGVQPTHPIAAIELVV